MNKLKLLFCFLFISSFATAQIYVENFNYTEGIYLFQTGNWTNINSPDVGTISVLSPGLTFPGYAGSGIGNSAALSSTGNDVYSLFSAAYSDGSVYAAFMLRVFYPFTDGEYFFALRSSEPDYYARVHIKQFDSPKFQLAVTKSGQKVNHFDSTLFDVGSVYILVVKYKFISGADNDEVSLFVFDTSNPPPLTEPAPTILPETNNVPDAPDINGVSLWQSSETSTPLFIYLDGIYVYRSWFTDLALPVELTSFTSSVYVRDVILNWTTSGELNNSHFDIERFFGNNWSRAGSIAGSGTISQPVSYSFTDKNLSPGKYKYRLKQIDFNGNSQFFNLENEVEISNPEKFSLDQNYPNPFNPETNINYHLPVFSFVSIKVFDNSGKEVMTLLNDFREAGSYSVKFDGSYLPSGVYFYKLTAGDFTEVKSMVLVK